MSGNTSRRDNRPADHYQHDRISEPEQLENETGKPLNPVVAWGVVLLASVALWGGLGLAISSVVSALLWCPIGALSPMSRPLALGRRDRPHGRRLGSLVK